MHFSPSLPLPSSPAHDEGARAVDLPPEDRRAAALRRGGGAVQEQCRGVRRVADAPVRAGRRSGRVREGQAQRKEARSGVGCAAAAAAAADAAAAAAATRDCGRDEVDVGVDDGADSDGRRGRGRGGTARGGAR